MKNQNSPEVITVNDQNFGSHGEHWNLLTSHPETDVPKWLGLALDAPVMPMGLCQNEDEMDQSFWLIQGPQGQKVTINQIIAVENQKPRALKLPSRVLIVLINIMPKLSASLLVTLLLKQY